MWSGPCCAGPHLLPGWMAKIASSRRSLTSRHAFRYASTCSSAVSAWLKGVRGQQGTVQASVCSLPAAGRWLVLAVGWVGPAEKESAKAWGESR